MILNQQQDNTQEGDYLTAEAVSLSDSSIKVKMPDHFFISTTNCTQWLVGWGNNQPLYDAGVENLRSIKSVDKVNNVFTLGAVLRGQGFPAKGQRIVFWNRTPSGFSNRKQVPVINPSMWPGFSGQSIHFSSIEYDSLLRKWVILVNEVYEYDTKSIQIYAALSDNLIDWKAANAGKPILRVADFRSCTWVAQDKTKRIPQTPFVSDIIRHDNKWYVFLHGYSADGKRHIGLAVSETSLLGPYRITKNPILSPGPKGSWDEQSVYYAKVKKYKKDFILFYDGSNSAGHENVGKAVSPDLTHWTKSARNPVLTQHSGWRSQEGFSAPANVEVRNDSLLLIAVGAKRFKVGPWHHYVTRRMYMDKSGNVDDAQLGLYLSTDEGESFVAHQNNPVFTNDYSNKWENEHMGSNFRLIRTDTADFVFYQAKSSYQGYKYNILLRQKNKQRQADQ